MIILKDKIEFNDSEREIIETAVKRANEEDFKRKEINLSETVENFKRFFLLDFKYETSGLDLNEAVEYYDFRVFFFPEDLFDEKTRKILNFINEENERWLQKKTQEKGSSLLMEELFW